jgi:HPt (histidine-containing phosphotransfer) domain-containing protein
VLFRSAAGGTQPPAEAPGERFEQGKIEELKELGAGAEPQWFETLVRQYLKDSSDRLVMLREAIRSGESKTVEELAHALKGSSGTMGALGMRLVAEQLQTAGRSGALGDAGPLVEELAKELDQAERYLTAFLVEKEAAP